MPNLRFSYFWTAKCISPSSPHQFWFKRKMFLHIFDRSKRNNGSTCVSFRFEHPNAITLETAIGSCYGIVHRISSDSWMKFWLTLIHIFPWIWCWIDHLLNHGDFGVILNIGSAVDIRGFATTIYPYGSCPVSWPNRNILNWRIFWLIGIRIQDDEYNHDCTN